MAEQNTTCEEDAVSSLLHTEDQLETCSVKKTISQENYLEEIVSCVMDEKISYPSEFSLHESGKSEETANKLRIDGNRFYKAGDYGKALQLYNCSIINAPHPVLKDTTQLQSELTENDDIFTFPPIDLSRYGGITEGESIALSKGFANRSAIMLHLRLYEKCISDIDLAFQYGLPENLRFKLQERKQYCLDNMSNDGDEPGASKLSSHSQSEELHELTQHLEKCNKSPSLQAMVSHKLKDPPTIPKPCQTVPSFSSSVEVCYMPSKQRGVVAVQDICPGEVICVERAYCMSVNPDYLETYCSTCLRFCLTPLPCPGCCVVVFCSKACQMKSLYEDHWLECRILPKLLSMNASFKTFSYKMLKTHTHEQMEVILSQLEDEKYDRPVNLGCDRKGLYNSSSYRTVHHLCTNKDKAPPDLLVKLARHSVLLTKLLVQSGRYFINSYGEAVIPSRESLVFTGALLLSHLLRMNFNQFKLLDDQNEEKILGVGIYPAASLFNHSCNASVGEFMYGRVLVLRALRPIKTGEEVTFAYKSGFSEKSLEERRNSLFAYQFLCRCEACTGNWSVYEQLPKFRCIACHEGACSSIDICADCRLKHSTLKNKNGASKKNIWNAVIKKIHEATVKANLVDYKLKNNLKISREDTETACKSMELVHRHMAVPCQCICFLENVLLGCFQAEI